MMKKMVFGAFLALTMLFIASIDGTVGEVGNVSSASKRSVTGVSVETIVSIEKMAMAHGATVRAQSDKPISTLPPTSTPEPTAKPEKEPEAETNTEETDSAPSDPQVTEKQLIWMGWTEYESGEKSKSWEITDGDGGHAYGRYQFDDRHCLAEFFRFCVNNDRENYEPFTTFYQVDSKGKAHIKNTDRIPENWSWICHTKGENFYEMQTKFAVESYYQAAKKTLEQKGIKIGSYGPVLRGTIMSIAIRDGHYESGLSSVINTYRKGITEEEWLAAIYMAEKAKHPDQSTRWGEKQKKLALEALLAYNVSTSIDKLEKKFAFEPVL